MVRRNLSHSWWRWRYGGAVEESHRQHLPMVIQ
jgi:hypothetical protein